VAKGDTVIANYLGQTWAPRAARQRLRQFVLAWRAGAFVIGKGQVIPDGSRHSSAEARSRLLLTVPPADGYGANGQSSAGITGTDTLVFVVDLVSEYSRTSAPGTVVSNIRAAATQDHQCAGQETTITSTAASRSRRSPRHPARHRSGAKIDTAKTLVLQLVQTDLQTGKNTRQPGRRATTVSAQNVLSIADKLSGQNVGSRWCLLRRPRRYRSSTQAAQPASPRNSHHRRGRQF